MAAHRPQTALREMRAHLLQPRTLAVLAIVGFVLAIVGPFGTDRYLPVATRAAFWLAIVFGTYFIGAATDLLLRPRLDGMSGVARGLTLGVATGLFTGLAVEVFTAALFGWPSSLSEALRDFAPIFAIGLCVSLGIQIANSTPEQGTAATATDALPPLLERLPLEKRGLLLSLSVEDHYVRVRTVRGEEMLLMRLSDAIRETAPTPGLQVHRSHWVAREAVASVRRTGDRAILTLHEGGDIPASRSHIPALKAAGLLSR